MPTLLRIDASARTKDSHSKEIADLLQQQWLQMYPEGKAITRDIINTPIPHIHADTINGYYTAKEQHTEILKKATALSDKLISELRNADTLLISTPMYNFSVPSCLKAWIDQIVRIGYTFGFDEAKGLHGLLEGKNAYIVTATGAVFSGGSLDAVDFLHPYLKAVLGLIGIHDIVFINIEGTTTDETAMSLSKTEAARIITKLFSAAHELSQVTT